MRIKNSTLFIFFIYHVLVKKVLADDKYSKMKVILYNIKINNK
jgi:hypothetical protein